MMVFGLVGETPAAVERVGRHATAFLAPGQELGFEELRELGKQRGMLVGTTDEVVDELARLGQLGLQEALFQHFDFDSDELPEYLHAELVPRVKSL